MLTTYGECLKFWGWCMVRILVRLVEKKEHLRTWLNSNLVILTDLLLESVPACARV